MDTVAPVPKKDDRPAIFLKVLSEEWKPETYQGHVVDFNKKEEVFFSESPAADRNAALHKAEELKEAHNGRILKLSSYDDFHSDALRIAVHGTDVFKNGNVEDYD